MNNTPGVVRATAIGASNSTVSNVVGSVAGLQSFSWKNVAASAVAAGAGYAANRVIGQAQYGSEKWNWMSQGGTLQSAAAANDGGQTALRGVGSGIAAGVGSAAVRGNLTQSWAGIAQDVIGSTVGNAIAEQMASRSSALQGKSTDVLMQMDNLARYAGKDPGQLSNAQLNVLAQAAETSTAAGQHLSNAELIGRTDAYLADIVGLNSAQRDDIFGLYNEANLFGTVTVGTPQRTGLFVQASEAFANAANGELLFGTDTAIYSASSQERGSWLSRPLDTALIGTGSAARAIADQIDSKPWLKFGLVGLEVAAGPAKFAVSQTLQATGITDFISDRVIGYVGGNLASVGYEDPQAVNGGIGAMALTSLAATGTFGLAKRIGTVVTGLQANPAEGIYRGGAYGRLAAGPGIERHHFPANSVSPFSTYSGPAIHIDKVDHGFTSSHTFAGQDGKLYRAEVRTLINQGRMRDAIAKEIWDIRRAAVQGGGSASKYNQAIKEALDYSRGQGWIVK
ncbi:hypothetical protein [Dyella sp.]|uniref:hypothetical protein n=1 Tax=Dyella sp. TaxID=1869338 RepID=UPI002FD97291